MQKLFFHIVLAICIVSCSKQKELLPNTSSTIAIDNDDTKDSIIFKAAHVVPTLNQYEALKNEFIAFIHFGPNTFTKMEWGDGFEDPKVFSLQNLDTDQWCKTMKEANMKMVILTVKHHDGFVLWQSRYTKHGIMSSPFKEGKGDILKELSESCKKYGLKLGIYLSPADLYQIESKEGLYGNLSKYSDRVIPRPVEGRPFKNKKTFTFNVDDYNEYFLNQLFELLTEYGSIHEVWFDGAHPKRKGNQQYNYNAWKNLIRTLAPKAVIFGRQDIRWCGNEAGATRDTEWNIIPYQENPNQMNRFADLTETDLGSREKLYKGKFLHYQQAETNTSIREGWFYRDENKQKVRSTDDVFDMYERSVGGNSTFLLNIPPNREGKFSDKDVQVLKELGQRIEKTYATNLFESAKGVKEVLDGNSKTYKLINKDNSFIEITTPKPITINRLALQEAIATHSERIEKHVLDAWVNNQWVEIAKATNVGYKRILRFPNVTSNKFRIRVLESRLNPAISNITAHYYEAYPPQLSITRDFNGKVSIVPKKHNFNWKPHGENIQKNLNSGIKIYYTTNSNEPNTSSKVYTEPFLFEGGTVKAIAVSQDKIGSITSKEIGILKGSWKPFGSDSFEPEHFDSNAIDGNPNTFWLSKSTGNDHYFTINLGSKKTLKGFSYTPPKTYSDGMIEQGEIKISNDAIHWKTVEVFKFGNLINDPTPRTYTLKKPITTQYIRIQSKVIAGGKKQAAIAELDFFEL